jgi:hypothetical protein
MKAIAVVLMAVMFAALAPSGASAAELNFGGDLGFYLFDMSSGTSRLPYTDTLGNRVGKDSTSSSRVNMQFGSHGLGLYWNVQLTDEVSVNALTEVGASAGATPRLNRAIDGADAEATFKALSLPEANISVVLPWQLQLTAGILRPIFSVDYGEKKGYQEANRLFKSSANSYGGEWHDLGIELYKSFEPGGGFSIPAYAYVLAGERMFGDNNSNKALLFHVAPQFSKFTLLGSYGFGTEAADKLPDDTTYDPEPWSRYAMGLAGDFGPVWFRGEFFGGGWEGATMYNHGEAGAIDTLAYTRKPVAYYVKAGVNIIPDKLGFVLCYDQYNQDWTTWGRLGYASGTSNQTTDDNESYTTIGATVQYWVIPGSSVLLEYNRGMWKVGDGALCKVDFNRVTLGWRTVF